MRVLVAGATGFVGKRLVEQLCDGGHTVVAFSRSATPDDFENDVEVFNGELGNPDSLDGLCEGVDVAYYFIHSLTSDNFAEKDREYADRFQRIASSAGVDRVIYLSGISGDEGDLSPHLESRREVEDVLSRGSFDLTVLRAAIIIGQESASFRIVDDLTDRLPVMLVPKWVRTPCQPIGIDDAVEYLFKLLDYDETRGMTYDIGAEEVCSYQELLRRTANAKGKRIMIVPVPVMTPELSSYWLKLTTDVQYAIARPLVESMKHPVTVSEDKDLQKTIQIDRDSIEEAIRSSLQASSSSL